MGVTPDPMIPVFTTVKKIDRETHDTVTLTLDVSPFGGRFAFTPGQFNMLYLLGVGEVAISISGDPAKTDRLVHTVRAVGSVTKKVVALKKGDAIGVRGPFGAGWPLDGAAGGDVVVVAGGLGLAPLRPVVYSALRTRARFGHVSVLVGARGAEGLSFAEELAKWKEKLDVQVTVDRADSKWKGDVGVVTRLVEKAAFEPSRASAYVCGPEIMMRFVARALEQRGVARSRIHVSLERNMKCAVGFCGHCQLGPEFICRDGPVFPFERVESALAVKEL